MKEPIAIEQNALQKNEKGRFEIIKAAFFYK